MEATVSKAEYDELHGKYEALRDEFEQLKRLIFGSKRERFVAVQSPEQLALALGGDPVEAPDQETETITYQRRKPNPHPGRTALPENIPTEDIIIEPDCGQRRF